MTEEDKAEDSDWDEGLYQQGCHLLRVGSKGGLKGREKVIEGQEIMEMCLSLPLPINAPYEVQCSDPPQEDDGNQRAGLEQMMHKDNSCLSLPPPISCPSDSQTSTYSGCDASRLVFQTSTFGGRVPVQLEAKNLQVAPAEVLHVVQQPGSVSTRSVFRQQPSIDFHSIFPAVKSRKQLQSPRSTSTGQTSSSKPKRKTI